MSLDNVDGQLRNSPFQTMMATVLAKGIAQKEYNLSILEPKIFLELKSPYTIQVRFHVQDLNGKGKEQICEGEIGISNLMENFKNISLVRRDENDNPEDVHGDKVVTKFLKKEYTSLFDSEGNAQPISPELFNQMISACSPERREIFANELLFSGKNSASSSTREEYIAAIKDLLQRVKKAS